MRNRVSVLLAFLMLASMSCIQAQKRRSNPIVSHMFTADPSTHVWNDGRLYLYPSSDPSPSRGYSTMDGYHVFSTDDMITWKDHGEILHSKDVEWGRKKGGFMWAPDCAYKNGVYYYYFPHPSGDNIRKTWKIGVATSTKPASGFKVQGYIKGIKTLIDPCVFIDDDGQAYLFQGGEGDPTGYKLKENMLEVDGEPHSIEGLDGFREGLWMFKRKGIYYIIYPDDFPKRNKMRYAMSDSVFGPFKNNEVFIGSTDIITMHGSVVEYKDQWYAFYHNGNLSGVIPTNRSVCFDPIYFNEDGTIQMVKQTLGVELPTFHDDINFNGMFGTLSVGDYKQADMEKQGIKPNAISSLEIPKGYMVTCFEKDNFSGKSWVFEENNIDLNIAGCSDKIRSIKVSKLKGTENNLVKNSSFELGTGSVIRSWTARRTSRAYTRSSENSKKGSYALKYKGKAIAKPIAQKIELKPNTNYEFSCYLKIDVSSKGKVLLSTNGNFDDTCKFELDASTKAGEWVAFTGVFNSKQFKNMKLSCSTSQDFKGVCYWDNIIIKEKIK